MKEQLEKIRQEALGALESVKDAGELDALRVRFLGKKGELTGVLKTMGKLSAEERPVMGQAANNVRAAIEEKIETVRAELKEKAMEARLEAEAIDVTIPGTPVQLGHRHPMNKALDEAKDIFISMGFKILDGPEVELADYNFTKLNIAENHPSRDRSDTFYVTDDEEVLLRTQTSPMQIRAMEAIGQPPIRILAPGRVYRKDEVDATHSPMFHQIEGLVIDKGITMADLRARLRRSSRPCTARIPLSASARTTSRSPSRAVRSTCSASTAAARAARPARARAGSSCWVPVWCTRRYWPAAILTRKSTPASPSASALSVWPCAGSRSAICA